MGGYLLNRFALGVLTIFVVSSSLFFFIRQAPGDAADAIVGQQANAYQLDVEKLRAEFGLNKPIWTQYREYWAGVIRGDFGDSLYTRQPVAGTTISRAGVSAVLALMALTMSLLMGIPLGIVTALRRNSAADVVLRGWVTILLAVPVFWMGLLVVVLPSKYFHWTPSGLFVGFENDLFGSLKALVIPAIVLGIPGGAVLTRYVRTEMLTVLRQDYVRTAHSKGLSGRTVIVRHALRNTMIPVLSVIGLSLPALIGGAVIIERIFVIPGLGNYILTAVTRRDYPALMSANMVIAMLVVLTNLMVDISYGIVDPRIRRGA
jgi:peptide/nickel transport system permease protein